MTTDFVVQELAAVDRDLRYLVAAEVLKHPLPWQIERHWKYKIRASDGHVVATMVETFDQAREIIDLAQQIQQEAS